MKMIYAAFAASVLILAACGGGGGGLGGPEREEPMPQPQVDPQTPERQRLLGSAAEYGPEEAYGPPRKRVLAYLRLFATGGAEFPSMQAEDDDHPDGIAVFREPPILRIGPGTNDHQRALIHHAVALVNRALPWDRHIRIGPDAPQPRTPIEEVEDGQIFVDFAPRDAWRYDGHEGVDRIQGLASLEDAIEDDEIRQRLSARIWMLDTLSPSDRSTMFVMVHELLHTIGLAEHVFHDEWRGTFLGYTRDGRYGAPHADRQVTQLGAIDTAALVALVRILDRIGGTAVMAENLAVDDFGEWETEALAFSDRRGGMSWGVRHYNGITVPWTDGSDPDGPLANNLAFGHQDGTATWNGNLLGFTPAQAPVAGRARISVDLDSGASLAGRADFTDLQSWAIGSRPGALGTGQQWDAGALHYTIIVGGNYLRSTGGDGDDAGSVNGRFYGRGHEGVAGVVEREDLTAAFGARR